MTATVQQAVLTSEWTKARTLRSTTWPLLLTVVASVGLSVAFGLYLRGSFDRMPVADQRGFNTAEFAVGSVVYGQILLVAFGVLVVCSEYSGGTIRTSLAAVPRRGTFYSAKVLVGTALALVVSAVTVAGAYLAAHVALGSRSGPLLGPDESRILVGSTLYLTLICAFSIGVATMLRSAALSLGTLIPFFFVVSNILGHVPVVREIGQYLPDQAGHQIMVATPRPDSPLGPWTGLLVMAAWAVVALGGGYVLLTRRDA
ncbi:ABC transporter permease subunit [Umezawaea tangerina]|uniref:ABC-2 type transport system permease protein n=1 Tax=Umezawaea tangerina TaxID=84725 RepID=A0A2T0T743_9PSEU|nr:ABC transporter permease subunit [Umezawaea tangerina]PRY41467.1 ABC-2 type transport system permease protein [Umezawaea tangerina]